ncbi:hypothetical protein ABZP36_021055 [Zizania latifolia]
MVLLAFMVAVAVVPVFAANGGGGGRVEVQSLERPAGGGGNAWLGGRMEAVGVAEEGGVAEGVRGAMDGGGVGALTAAAVVVVADGDGGSGGAAARGGRSAWRGRHRHRPSYSSSMYRVGEYARCTAAGRCGGTLLVCPMQCEGPCFYDCSANCKAHCRF